MKGTVEELNKIRGAFYSMKSRSDFLSVLNQAKAIIYGKKYAPFELKQLTYYSNVNVNKNRYVQFSIRKRSGELRLINSPRRGLKAIQKCLNLVLSSVFKPHKNSFGFTINRSVYDNASVHTGKNYVYNIDLKDFFLSIDQARVWACLKIKPFYLNDDNNRLGLANIMASLCCTELEVERDHAQNGLIKLRKNVVPQGAPTSPLISNIVCQKLDYLMSAVAKRFNLDYSRYADDITFSSMHNVYQEDSDFINEVKRILKQQRFTINDKKTRLQKYSYRQEVTGLSVNVKVNTPRRYIKEIRKILYLWETYGYEKANFIVNGSTNSFNVQFSSMLINGVAGKLNYLRMIKGPQNSQYEKLKQRFDKLIEIEKATASIEPATAISNYPEPELHHPRNLVDLLGHFTENGNPLKYSTHTWESGSYENCAQFVLELSREWKKIESDVFALRKRLAAKIDSFLDSEKVYEKGWGPEDPRLRIRYGWRSPELLAWCEANPSKSPFYFPIPKSEIITIDGITTNYFYNVTEIFKRQIEIREENNHLYNIFLNLRKNVLGYDFKLEQVETKGQSFYTDVHSFSTAVTKIFESIRKRPQYPNVKIICSTKGTELEIKIIHIDSHCSRVVNDHRIINATKGDFGSIKNELYNLCDWSIESKFQDDRTFKVNYLMSSPGEKLTKSLSPCDGFTHIFKFYL